MMKITGVYIIKNKVTNKFYVGHSIDINKRFNAHKSYLKRNIHHCIYLQRSWNKYGEDNFEFITVKSYISEEESIKLEQYYIDNFKNDIYNTGDYANSGGDLLSNNPNRLQIIHKRIESQKKVLEKMSKSERIEKFSRSGVKNGMYGKSHTSEVKKLISSKNKGNIPVNKGKSLEENVGELKAKEIKKNLSDLAKNRVGNKNPFYGKHHSEESKLKLKNAMIGKKPVNSKKVRIDNVIYESLTDASRKLNVVPATILYRIRSKNYPTYEYYDI